MSRSLIIIGIGFIIIGIFWPYFIKIGLGRLPGDIIIQSERYKIYFPITTFLLISVLLSLIVWLIRR